ncbi:MAG: hypothetical protein AB2693_34965, partial [Candidatus Thiodiazotropha sp.]
MDKKRALEKKLLSSVNHIKISFIQKDQNYIYDMTAGMFELYRSEVIRFYDNLPEKRQLKVVFKPIMDAENAVVETQIKVHQRTHKGCGQLKFTINLYHTTSRVMANGKDMETFRTDNRKILEGIMSLNIVESLDAVLQRAVRTQLETMTSPPLFAVNPVPKKKAMKAIKSQVPSSSDGTGDSDEDGNRDDSFVDALWYCPCCKEKVDDGVACDLCGSWYHYICEKLTDADTMIIEAQREYYCSSCRNENCEEMITDSLMQGSPRGDNQGEADADGELEQVVVPPTVILEENDTDNQTALVRIGRSASKTPQRQSGQPLTRTSPSITSPIQIPVLPPVTKVATTVTNTNTPVAKTVDLPGPTAAKGNRQKRSKRGAEQNDSADQLKLAQTLIGNLERQVLDLKDSNNLLKRELQLSQNVCDDAMTGAENGEKLRVPKTECQHSLGTVDGNVGEIPLLRDRLTTLEHEILKLRLQSIESAIFMYGRAPSGTGNYSHPLQAPYLNPALGMTHQMQYPPTIPAYPTHPVNSVQHFPWIAPHGQPYILQPQFIPGQPSWFTPSVQPHFVNPIGGLPQQAYVQGQPLIIPQGPVVGNRIHNHEASNGNTKLPNQVAGNPNQRSEEYSKTIPHPAVSKAPSREQRTINTHSASLSPQITSAELQQACVRQEKHFPGPVRPSRADSDQEKTLKDSCADDSLVVETMPAPSFADIESQSQNSNLFDAGTTVSTPPKIEVNKRTSVITV